MLGQEVILGKDVFEWLISYGYPILIIISLVDSTYIGFFAGMLSALGVFTLHCFWHKCFCKSDN